MKCEFCGTTQDYGHVNYHSVLNGELCIRCIDKLLSWLHGRDIDEFWIEVDAIRNGFPPFPYEKVKELDHKYFYERAELVNKIRRLDHQHRRENNE